MHRVECFLGQSSKICILIQVILLRLTQVILSYIIWKDLRTTPRRLLLYLAVCDLVTAMFNVVGLAMGDRRLTDNDSPTTECLIQ